MRYVQRDAAGNVVGHFANPQSYAREAVPDDHPDLATWQRQREALRPKPEDALSVRVPALEKRVRELTTQVEQLLKLAHNA